MTDDTAITWATRIFRPSVTHAYYAYDQGRYWRVETLHDGTVQSLPLRRPPAGAVCRASNDRFATSWRFVVPGRPGTVVACLVLAVLAVPGAWLLLPGSVPAVRLIAGTAAATALILQAVMEHLASRDPAAARRLSAVAATYLVFTHRHRARHH